MGLFYGRPLSLFCLIFLSVSFIAQYFSAVHSIVFVVVFALIAILLFVISKIQNKAHAKITTAFLCFLVAALAILHSVLFVGIPKDKAQSYCGERNVSCIIIDKEYDNTSSDTYYVIIDNIDGKNVNIKADLICYFNTDLKTGDGLYARMYVSDEVSSFSQSKGRILSLQVENKTNCYVRHTSERPMSEILFSTGGIEIISNKLSNFIENILVSKLGVEKGSLAMGLFTGERGGMPVDVTRDFRRSGLTHLMAVSGSHIAILLGTVDMLLRKLFVDKKYRCIIVSIFSVAFLFVSGFSLSGCRSVLMLYSVYLSFLFYEDNDSITSLFVSVAIIVLISPYSVSDVGLIMSFLATLGLLTMYPAIESRIPYPRKGSKLLIRILIMLRQALVIMLMTVVANAFLLPIIWWFFGEISVVSILSNVVVSPLVSVFLILIPAYILVCKVPVISVISTFIVKSFADIILALVRLFSKLPNAVFSLRYDFCTVIIIAFTVSMIILLAIKLKRKYLIILPTVLAIFSYAICFGVCSAFIFKPELTYVKNYTNEILYVDNGTEFSVCDISDSGYFSYNEISSAYNASNATEISSFVLTHYNKNVVKLLEMLTNEVIVRNLYAPIPETDADIKTANDIFTLAEERGVNIEFYDADSNIKMCNGITLNALASSDHNKGSFLAFVGKDTYAVYSTPYYQNRDFIYDYLIKGVHFGEVPSMDYVKYKIPLSDT